MTHRAYWLKVPSGRWRNAPSTCGRKGTHTFDDIGASQKRALDSYTQRLIEHILKLNYWKQEVSRCSRGWILEVANFRTRINRFLKKNPSLKNYLKSEYSDIYQNAVKLMRLQFEIPEDNFIELEQIMDEDYYGNVSSEFGIRS